MKTIANLAPEIVWSIFSEILTIARPSKQEDAIRAYLLNFAKQKNLNSKVDAKGNVVIIRESDDEFTNSPAIVLQSHMDMVCEKDSTLVHDFLKDPINAYIENGWVKARGTTLGADCGIGMALSLAALTENTLKCAKIEALFTVDEEQGLSGAMELDKHILTGKYLLNLDSEDEGEIFIGCAGGIDTLATFNVNFVKWTKEEVFKITVGGLLGGHSGDDIEKGRACANKLLTRVLIGLKETDYELVMIDGGNLRNAIARDAYAIVRINSTDQEKATEIFQNIYQGIQTEYKHTDKDIVMDFAKTASVGDQVIAKDDVWRLIYALQSVCHGVIAYSNTMVGLVETSTNLASVKMNKETIVVTTSQRSSIESAKHDIANTVAATFTLAGAKVYQSDGYPGWTPNPNSKLVKMAESVYTKNFKKEPKIKAIHAGLECGLILEKYPNMEAISIGPTLRGVHSPSEKLEISTVALTWTYILEMLKNLS